MAPASRIRRAAAAAAESFRAPVAAAAVERLETRRMMHAGHDEPEAVTFEAFGLSAADFAPLPAPLAATAPKHPLSSVPALSSRPIAPATLYLDFNGDTTDTWGDYSPGRTPAMDADGDASTFTDGALATIREACTRVSDDFSPS